MKLSQLFLDQGDSILAQATHAVTRAALPHYPTSSPDTVRDRLSRLLQLTGEAVNRRNLGPILKYAQQLGEERFQAGYPLHEVQTAINVLEEALWEHCVRLLPASELPEALGLCSTALGETKDVLARTYVSLASGTHVPSLNLQALFEGIES